MAHSPCLHARPHHHTARPDFMQDHLCHTSWKCVSQAAASIPHMLKNARGVLAWPVAREYTSEPFRLGIGLQLLPLPRPPPPPRFLSH